MYYIYVRTFCLRTTYLRTTYRRTTFFFKGPPLERHPWNCQDGIHHVPPPPLRVHILPSAGFSLYIPSRPSGGLGSGYRVLDARVFRQRGSRKGLLGTRRGRRAEPHAPQSFSFAPSQARASTKGAQGRQETPNLRATKIVSQNWSETFHRESNLPIKRTIHLKSIRYYPMRLATLFVL